MKRSAMSAVIGALVLTGVTLSAAEVEAMPVQPLASAAVAAGPIEHVWWRGYGYRGYGFRRGFYGYGFRPGFYGYGFRRPFYGYGYGYRRPWGWRRW